MIKLLLVLLFFCGCAEKKQPESQKPKESKKVRVAALQYYSRMGDKEYNWQLCKKLAVEAAGKGAKILVLPEAAVTGYMDPAKDLTWTSGIPGEGEMSIKGHAEKVEGEYIKKYLGLAAELKVYLAIPFVEEAEGKFFNSSILSSPKGEILLHHRKKSLWTHGDSGWCEEGDLKPQIAETEYGKLGLMICYDVHSMPEILSELQADIVLYSVGWFGPNTEDWYKRRFPNKHVIPNNFSVIAANWSHERGQDKWPGCGWSNIVYRNGVLLNITNKIGGETIVFGSIPLN